MQNQIRDLPLADLKPIVQVYAIMSENNQYEDVGTGSLQIVTDSDLPEPQHYIEVTTQDTKQLILRSRLQARNNFQRQKSSIICWQDIEQLVSQELALSFEKVEECDTYWKLVCEKIGKNYLQINGNEALQNPTENNLAYLFDKVKNSYNLIAFHIINSSVFMEELRHVFFCFQEKNDKMGVGTIMRIIKEIFSHSDHKVILNLLTHENFAFLLELYKQNTDINFPEAYKKRVQQKQLIPLSLETKENIEIFHHYMFFRDCMMDLAKEVSLEQMLNIWIRQTEIIILNNILQEKILWKLTDLYKEEKNKASFDQKSEDILTFLFEILWMLKLAQSDTLRKKYIDSFYQSGILKVLEELIQKNKYKALEFFDFLCIFDPKSFLTFFKDQFRENPSLNFNRVVSKEYTSNSDISMANSIINFLTNFISQIVDKKDFLQFFNGTFIFSIFSTCNLPFRNLPIIRLIFEKSSRVSGLINIIIRTKYFYKLPLQDKIEKKSLLELFKVVKMIISLIGKNTSEKSVDEIEEQSNLVSEVIESGTFSFCLEYLKKRLNNNSLLVSSMLENLSLLSEVGFNQFTKVVQEFDFELQDKQHKNDLIRSYLSKINSKDIPKIESELTKQNLQTDTRKKHIRNLQAEEEERYLLDDDNQGQINQDNGIQEDNQLQQLLKMKKQIENARSEEDSKFNSKAEKREEQKPINFQFTFHIEGEEPE